jgi:hypothetical protein
MITNFDMKVFSKGNVEATTKVWGQVYKGVQAIAAETAEYCRKSPPSVAPKAPQRWR